MSDSHVAVVDMGCKLGNAIQEFVKKGSLYYDDDIRSIKPGDCLGVDRQDRFRGDLEARGYRFLHLDITAENALLQLPAADYYLAWDFLEHLPNLDWVSAVVKVMLHKARKGVWIRMPSFEQDATGEGALKEMGLRFAWTNWHGHPSAVLVEDVVRIVNDYKAETLRSSVSLKLKPSKRVMATDDPCVVPIDAPMDTAAYNPNLGVKPVKNLDPPLVAQWEAVIKI